MKTMALVLLMSVGSVAFARAYYAPKEAMIKKSCAIAIVNVASVKKVDTKGKHWTYKEMAVAKVERTLKGKLPSEIELLGDESFICAQCRFSPGRALVFLKPEGRRWACSNWHLALRTIKGDRVRWFTDNKSASSLSPQLLETVLKDVESVIAKSPASKPGEDPCTETAVERKRQGPPSEEDGEMCTAEEK